MNRHNRFSTLRSDSAIARRHSRKTSSSVLSVRALSAVPEPTSLWSTRTHPVDSPFESRAMPARTQTGCPSPFYAPPFVHHTIRTPGVAVHKLNIVRSSGAHPSTPDARKDCLHSDNTPSGSPSSDRKVLPIAASPAPASTPAPYRRLAGRPLGRLVTDSEGSSSGGGSPLVGSVIFTTSFPCASNWRP